MNNKKFEIKKKKKLKQIGVKTDKFARITITINHNNNSV